MRVIKKLLSMTLAATIVLSGTACSTRNTESTGKWVDSGLFENLDQAAKASVRDDYAAAINYEWASVQEQDFTFRSGPYGEAERKIMENKLALIGDESIEDPNLEPVRIAYGLFDLDYRDTLGVEPLKKYLARIDAIASLSDVSAYMIDNENNPFAMSLVDMAYAQIPDLASSLAINIKKPARMLNDKDDYYILMSEDGFQEKERVEARIRYLLERSGYSKKEIGKVLSDGFEFESELVRLDYYEPAEQINPVTREELRNIAGEYPIEEMLSHYSCTTCNDFIGAFHYLDALDSVYTEKNVDKIKAYFKMRLCLDSIRYLDSEAFDCYLETNLDKTNPFEERYDKSMDEYFFLAVRDTSLTAAMDQVYLDHYYDQEVCDEITEMYHKVRDEYKIMIGENDTLSEESKKAVIEKLDLIREFILMPSNRADFSGVELTSAEEGGTYLDMLCTLNRIRYEHVVDMAENLKTKAYWDIYKGSTSTTEVNAYYTPAMNAIFINIGRITEPMFSKDDPYERKMAYIGSVIGHEISHAFDSSGIRFDADYNYSNVITHEELAVWEEMTDRIYRKLSSFEPFEGSGRYDKLENDISREVIADIEGVKVCLEIVKEDEDFDYDLFFRYYAEHFRQMTNKKDEMKRIKIDGHPLMYLRINYTLMQFEEFDELYGVKNGDGMYLDPDLRIVIW